MTARPIITVSLAPDGQLKVSLDIAPISGTTPEWFGELLYGLANGYADTVLHMGSLPGVGREQIVAQVARGFGDKTQGPT